MNVANLNPMAAIGHYFDRAAEKIRRALLELGEKDYSRDRDLFAYRAVFTNVNNGDTFSATIPVQTDSHFVWTGLGIKVVESTTKAPLVAVPAGGQSILSFPIRFQVVDTGMDRRLSEAQIDPETLIAAHNAGGAIVGQIPRPRMWRANSSILVEGTRYGEGTATTGYAAGPNVDVDIALTFFGFKIFK